MSQGPQQIKPKGLRKADIGLIIVIILLIIGVFIFVRNSSAKPDKLTYNDFRQYAIEGRIENATITPLGGDNVGYVNIAGEYRNTEGKKARYTVMISENSLDNEILPVFIQKNVTVDYKKMTSVDWFSIIVLIVMPVLLVVGMIIFFVRNAGGAAGTNRAFEFGRSRARLARHTPQPGV